MTLNEGWGENIFYWLRLLVLKLYGAPFVPATLSSVLFQWQLADYFFNVKCL